MNNVSTALNRYKCTGCSACANVCGFDALKMELDSEGFFKPYVDEEKCTYCGLCSKVCPALNTVYHNNPSPDCYALMASDDIRSKSSSGGAFQIISEIIFEKNGYVCGAAYTEDNRKVKHILIDNISEMSKLRGSKYIMSDMDNIYREIRMLLAEKKYVLFSGTPCQVAGLNSYLGNEADSEYLLTVDLICHGIPSVKAFQNYMRDVHGNRKISHLGFKDKEYGWHASMTIGFENGDVFNMPCEKDDYFRSYLNGLNKNSSCGECPFARIPRQGDITIGDFWGINNINPDFNDKKGTSVVLLNNAKAMSLVDKIKEKAKLFEKTELEGAVKGNSNLVSSPSIHKSRNQFFRNLDNRRYHDLVNWGFASQRYDVGIVGIPVFPNFGGTLTYYSLYRSLKDMGYTVALFSRPRSTGKPPINPDEIYNVNPFDKADLKLDFKDKSQMGQFANDNCENFVVGSDQLFNSDLYKTFGEIVTLDWISDNHRKVAYAASFGHNYFWGPENERAKMAHYMQKFDAFSVREEDGVDLAKRIFGVNAKWVLDPVFLCDPKHYYDIAENSLNKDAKPHIFEYILDPSEDKEKILNFAESVLDLPGELYSEMQYCPTEKTISDAQDRFKHKLIQGKVDNRLYSLINSDFIIADSFHGICFALIFNKPFVAILNPLRGATRFYTILGKLNLLDRMVTSYEELVEKQYLLTEPFDFTEANAILAKERKRSLKWLKEAVDPEHCEKKAFSTDDITDFKLRRIDNTMRINAIKCNAALTEKKYFSCRNIYDYLDKISEDLRELTVFISVKDTPGYALNRRINIKLSKLGIKTYLVDKHWHSFVAIIDSGRVVNEIISKNNERVAYVGKLSCGDVKVVSRSFNGGNIAYIGINGVDYSENKRGLNIVIYDKAIGEVVDSVCFDTHDEKIPYFRFGKKVDSIIPFAIKNEMISDTQYSVMPSESFPKDKLDVFYCCRLAVEKSAGRKILLWEDSKLFRDILKEYFNTDVEFVVTLDKSKVNGNSIRELAEIRDKKSEYYVLIPTIKYKSADEAMFTRLGFNYVDDYIYRYIRPVIIKNRDYGNEPYTDIFMNSITGDFFGNSTVILRGFNAKVLLGSKTSFGGDSELIIDSTGNSYVSLGDNIRFVGIVKLALMGDCQKSIVVGNSVEFIDNQLRIFGDIDEAEIRIGNRTTFNTDTCLHCNSGKKLIVGEDVMFSLNIRLLCGDGHSIFNVNTGKNVNSIPELLSPRQNELVIGNHVWVGMNVTMLAGTNIGDGSIIGANSLVKGVFPNNCVIGGNPAKRLKNDVAWCRRNCSTDMSNCGYEYVNYTEDENTNAKTPGTKTVLVLGGTRFMGVRLVEKLLERSYNVTIATRGKHPDNFGTKVKRIVYDRLNENIVAEKLAGKYFDIVIDTSAYCSASVDNILKNVKCGRYVQVSSVAVYPTTGDVLKNEEDFDSLIEKYEINSDTKNYGLAKRNSECVVLQKYSDVNTAIVRIPFVVECDNMNNPDLNSRLLFYVKALFEQTPIRIDQPDYNCTFVRTTDEADFLVYMAESDYRGVINFSSDGGTTVCDIMNYLEKKTQKKFIIKNDGVLHPFKFDSNGFCFNLEKAKKIGYKPVPLSDWLYDLLDEYIEQIGAECQGAKQSEVNELD